MKLYILGLVFICSCSFKPENKEATSKKAQEAQSSEIGLDSDGDGVSDASEIEKGSDPFVAEIPYFEGELFDEMSVKVDFYNKQTRETKNLSWSIEDGSVKFEHEEAQRKSSPGAPYMDTLLKNYASSVEFKRNDFKFFDYNEGIYSHSSPLLYEDSIFTLSDETLTLLKTGFDISRLELVIKSKFKIHSLKYTHFRNLAFDFYYKSKNREGLIYIETKRIDGTYLFNEENEVYIHFDSTDSKIINEAILSGGANLFLKLRDFTIYETDQRYSSILEKVEASSVPVTISYPEGENAGKSKIETLYVGTAGNKEKLGEILKKALKSDILMTSSSIDQIRSFSNRSRSYGSSGVNENLRWYIGSSEIGNTIYDQSYGPGLGLGLSYLSDKKTQIIPTYVSRSSLGVNAKIDSGLLGAGARDFKIKLKSNKILVPFEKITQYSRPDCGSGYWRKNEVNYQQIDLSYRDESHKLSEHLKKDTHIKVTSPKGKIIDANLGSLIKEGMIEELPSSDPRFGEFVFSKSLKKEILKDRSQIQIEVSLIPTTYPIRKNHITRVSERCQREHPSQHHGGGGGMGFLAAGVWSEEEEEVEYDLDLHIFSY